MTSSRRGRPRSGGPLHCDRCGRSTAKIRVRWPDGAICGICFTIAVRTHGTCPGCGTARLLPGLSPDGAPCCRDCAGITTAFDCRTCGHEGERYRGGACARCSLRADLTDLLHPDRDPARTSLVEALAAVQRPESMLTWLRSDTVIALLTGLGEGTIAMSHTGLDASEAGRAVEHLRAILEHCGLLPPRDAPLAAFDAWVTAKTSAISDPSQRHVVDRFARWHHQPRLEALGAAGHVTRGPTHSAKQEITAAIQFLAWLSTRHLDLASCRPLDLDLWITTGPSTRHVVRTFIVWAKRARLCDRHLVVAFRAPRTVPMLSQDARIALLRRCLVGSETDLSLRVAAMLVLLLAQPVTRIARMQRSQIVRAQAGIRLHLTKDPIDLPAPFSALVSAYLDQPATSGTIARNASPWLFPGGLAGRPIHPTTLTNRLHAAGIDLIGAKNAALRELVREAPPPVVAAQLGYSDPVIFRHAAASAQSFDDYAKLVANGLTHPPNGHHRVDPSFRQDRT